jgi:hypothetical protein
MALVITGESDHHIDLAEIVAQKIDGTIVKPLSSLGSGSSSIYSNRNGPSKCHDGDLAMVCASLLE